MDKYQFVSKRANNNDKLLQHQFFKKQKDTNIPAILTKSSTFAPTIAHIVFFITRKSDTVTLASSIGKWKQDTSLLQEAWPRRWGKASSQPRWANCSRPEGIG